ncbi:MAG TPA: dihydrolipoamide acetyltransferase family protein [Bacteroidia bacterium]|nr:dihydrolipoamide acetyltransferase family protein [Bacteroidia bacterium]
MSQVQLIMPKMGESVAEATILKWLKNVGDKVEADESILEIATDKVDSEIPSPASGILAQRMFEEGAVVQVGTVIAVITSEAEAPVSSAPATPDNDTTAFSPSVSIKETSMSQVPSPPEKGLRDEALTILRSSNGGRFFSPLVRNIAKQEGVSAAELETIAGTGMNQRVTKNDLLNHLTKRKQQPKPAAPLAAPSPAPERREIYQPTAAPAYVPSSAENVEIVEMDRMRKLIAEHMVMSKHTSPHVTSFVEADVTNIVMWRDRMKGEFEKREKEKLTFTPLFIDAIVRAIKDFPMVNVSVDGTNIIVKKDINIGMAAALPSGNLIVPVIKKADFLNLLGLTKMVNDFASRARANRLMPDEIQGGTFTITNVGTFGNLMGTPIINQPQVAIMATGAIKKKPVVIETLNGDSIGIRSMMFLSLSYDHRVVDGALGGSFLRRVADYLEQFDINRSI